MCGRPDIDGGQAGPASLARIADPALEIREILVVGQRLRGEVDGVLQPRTQCGVAQPPPELPLVRAAFARRVEVQQQQRRRRREAEPRRGRARAGAAPSEWTSCSSLERHQHAPR